MPHVAAGRWKVKTWLYACCDPGRCPSLLPIHPQPLASPSLISSSRPGRRLQKAHQIRSLSCSQHIDGFLLHLGQSPNSSPEHGRPSRPGLSLLSAPHPPPPLPLCPGPHQASVYNSDMPFPACMALPERVSASPQINLNSLQSWVHL